MIVVATNVLAYFFLCGEHTAAAESLLEREFESDSNDVLRLVSQSNCSAYDCEFVSLAKRLGVELVTMDTKLRKAFPDVAVSI
jgi:hypothetical protein